MRIALAGNPNSGKTTLYNALTGRMERVGNWAGVTVDKKESPIKKNFLKGNAAPTAVDLPGAYSMSPFTSEESITSGYVKNEKPDVIINIVDATNLSRSLFFTTQLLELGIPVVVALNKSDLTDKAKTEIDLEKLSKELNCPIVKTISTSSKGLEDLVETAISLADAKQKAPFKQGNVDLSDKHAVEDADKRRFGFVNGIVAKTEKRVVATSEKTFQDKIDSVIGHKVLGIPIFAVVMWALFSISQTYVGPPIGGYIEMFGEFVGESIEGTSPFLQALLVDGIIGGVGAVVGFLPLVMVMHFLIALLEDCGYMARVAVVMDPYFKKVGLSGKSIIPMVIGVACAIPGIMASRTIRNERERRATAMLTPFIPCGAKIPVIALFAGSFFDNAAWVSTVMYLTGILLIFIGALIISRITGYKNRKTFFIMELPVYKLPSIKRAFLSMLDRAKAFIVKAATIILVCNALVQIMQSFDLSLQLVEEGMEGTSILAAVATPFAFLLIPLGFGVWQLAAAAVTGFIAKENVVGTLAVVYGITSFIDVEELELIGEATQVASTMGITAVAALAYLMFNLYTPPCFAAIGSMNSEMNSKKWLWAGIGLQFGTGYVVAFLVYQIGTLITEGTVGTGFLPGLIAVAAIVAVIVYLMHKGDQSVKNLNKEAALSK